MTAWRMPAEWEPHAATWLAWPREKPEWGTRMHAVPWVFGEIVRALAGHEPVEILCDDEATRDDARALLEALGIAPAAYRLHPVPNDRVWLRDTAPTGVTNAAGERAWVRWRHWSVAATPDRFPGDLHLAERMAERTGAPLLEATREDGSPIVLEGGAIDVDGAGMLLATEPGVLRADDGVPGAPTRAEFEAAASALLGATRVVWLVETCAGDATRGHVDLVARWVAPGVIALAVEEDPADENHRRSAENLRRLARDAPDVRVVRLPFPSPRMLWGDRLPASYANFYVANGVVLVPTYNDANDARALATMAGLFPERRVVGINALDLVWGHGAIHCATHHEPAAARS